MTSRQLCLPKPLAVRFKLALPCTDVIVRQQCPLTLAQSSVFNEPSPIVQPTSANAMKPMLCTLADEAVDIEFADVAHLILSNISKLLLVWSIVGPFKKVMGFGTNRRKGFNSLLGVELKCVFSANVGVNMCIYTIVQTSVTATFIRTNASPCHLSRMLDTICQFLMLSQRA